MFSRRILFLLILPLVENSLYLYNTYDSLSVEFYDCITDNSLPYCRRPTEPIALQRDQAIWYCYHEGISHFFESLVLRNISVSTVLHEWNSSIEKAEEYSRYKKRRQLNERINVDENYLCECTDPQSFGKHCEYLLPLDTTFNQTIIWEVEMRTKNVWEMQMYSDIVCYTTLICDYGLLCLDWRDICDGVQHCMFGYDEENCDKLEFNECEDDEYRCVNGMCIPDQYFLDGEYDCLDLTDEKQAFKDAKCAFQPASHECDDRMCLRSFWSCGDGQCIPDPGDYFTSFPECNSFREQYHMCELVSDWNLWTLPNGKCYQSLEYEEVVLRDRTESEECLYFVKCALSQGGEKNCPCGKDFSCINQMDNPCPSLIIQYPAHAIMARYVFHFYNSMRDWSEKIPDVIIVNGTIKCRGYTVHKHMILNYPSMFYLRDLETNLCASKMNIISVSTNIGYDEFCYNNSRTFNNRLYNFIEICNRSKECISAYRIHDGYSDCFDNGDEKRDAQYPNSCSNIQRHRLRCSNEQPTCLPVNKLGDGSHDCRNDRDERWIEGGVMLSELVCNIKSKHDCEFIRQHVQVSGKLDVNHSSDLQFQLKKIPFRAYCDTFWNWHSGKDEDIELCRKWWKCPKNQLQCRSGQCIKKEWVLDGEWDCVDASDEEGLAISKNKFYPPNLSVVNYEELIEKFYTLYNNQSFSNICNLTVEYPCFRANVIDPLNLTENRPCINLHHIGDGHIDCAGGLDERNNLKYRLLPTMLGYCFQCSSADECIPYRFHCPARCNDNRVQCYGYQQAPNCSSGLDFMCLNGKCVKNGWCDEHFDCSDGEDELLCYNRKGRGHMSAYRLEKEYSVRITKQEFQLPQLPINRNRNQATDTVLPVVQILSPTANSFEQVNSSISYYCNRGVGVHLYNGLIACFCPPQYYGDKCQFHMDRVTFLFHLNLSQSIYAESNNLKLTLKFLIIFLNEDQPLMTESFQIHVADEIIIPKKKLFHLFYSRSNSSLYHKRVRYFNRSDIISKHPYSIRIEAYELNPSEKARLAGVWLYPVYYDFLPSFHLAKVLHLTKSDNTKNPCFSSPCNQQQECHQILNQNSTYVCLCRPSFKGHNCSIIDEMCGEGFCSLNSLCKATYRGLLSDNKQPYCICPLNKIGHRCDLIHDKCDPNPCQNHGTCLSTEEPHRVICLCDDYHYGDECQLKKRSVQLSITKSPAHRGAVVQYFDINFVSLDLLLSYQRVYVNLPDLLHYQYDGNIAPRIILVKLYSNTPSEFYLISIQMDVQSINGTTEMNEKNRCAHVQTLFSTEEEEEISPFQYHHLCIQNLTLLCFVDQSYLCICDANHNRTECFGYDHNLDQCSSCLAGGQCLKEDQARSTFLCLCPQCHYGSLCQFNIDGISFTLDSLLIQVNIIIRIMYLVFALLLFVIGGLINYAGIITCKRSNLRKSSIGIYILVLLIICQYSLFSLIMKLIIVHFDSLINDVLCKMTSYMLSVSSRCSFWLTSWIAIERVSYLLFPFITVLKNTRLATIISCGTLFIVSVMHVHELIFYSQLTDLNGRTACVVDFPFKLRTYDRITVILHYLIPFCIQIFSITILIILAARSRSRIGNNRDTFIEYLKRQFKQKKELYIPPSVIVVSGLPQIILSFSFACLELVAWQQHALLIAYFLSFAPQLLGFVIYILPSTVYMKEFQATKLSKTFLFRWISSKNKNQTRK